MLISPNKIDLIILNFNKKTKAFYSPNNKMICFLYFNKNVAGTSGSSIHFEFTTQDGNKLKVEMDNVSLSEEGNQLQRAVIRVSFNDGTLEAFGLSQVNRYSWLINEWLYFLIQNNAFRPTAYPTEIDDLLKAVVKNFVHYSTMRYQENYRFIPQRGSSSS